MLPISHRNSGHFATRPRDHLPHVRDNDYGRAMRITGTVMKISGTVSNQIYRQSNHKVMTLREILLELLFLVSFLFYYLWASKELCEIC